MRNVLRTLTALLFAAAIPAFATTPSISAVLPNVLVEGQANVPVLVTGKNFGTSGTLYLNGVAQRTPVVTPLVAQAFISLNTGEAILQFKDADGHLSATYKVPVKVPTTPSTPTAPVAPTKPTPLAPPTPKITWAAPSSIVYGTALSSTQLNATASVAGTFTYSPIAGTLLTAGTHALTVKFQPTETKSYSATTATVNINVAQAKPALAWAVPAPISTSTTLSAAQLDATSSVAGTFNYTPGTGTVLTAGTQQLTATFTPQDTTNYATGTVQTQITVNSGSKTWYIRADGGGRYSASRVAAGQGDAFAGCDGQADAPYPGHGTNQHCAFNDVRLLWDAQVDYAQTGWVIRGGDTVIIDNTKQWRIGSDSDGTTNPWPTFGWGAPNGIFGMVNPNIPAGTAQQHTRILGRNFGACSVGTQPDKTKMTQLFGSHGVWDTLNLQGTQYVDVQCLEITSHSACTIHGSPALPKTCNRYSGAIDEYDSDGIGTDLGTANILLQDIWDHGHTDRGILGAIGGQITLNRVDISTNGMAGWDLDPGNSTQSPNGSIVMHYSTIEWNGCNQVYPDTRPVYCYSQSTGGYGDGIGTPPGPMGSVLIDHSIFRYNTQDGEDFGHVYNAPVLSITDSASYGNNGGQFKWAGFQNVTFENNIAVANCLRMSQPITGVPSTFNQYLADYCRAGDALSFNFNNNANATIANNTIVTYANTTFDIQCYDSSSCAGTTLNMDNNIVLGYQNPTTWNMGGQQGGVGGYCIQSCNSSTLPLGRINRANNIYYGIRGNCIANQQQYSPGSVTGEMCLDPDFNNEPHFNGEASLDNFDFSLASSSPAHNGATTLQNLTTDYLGQNRNTPTSIGALEYGTQVNLNTLINWVGTN